MSNAAPTDVDDDAILFAEEGEDERAPENPWTIPPWTILIVDDDPDVHAMTRLLLDGVHFQDRPLALLGAFNAAEARTMLERRSDIAVILLDVVMERDSAGLDLVRIIRKDIGNRNVRIVLRTGQPGLAPPRAIIVDCDINDYKSKAELSADGLFITVIAALRAYDHIMAIETRVAQRTREVIDSRERLRAILEASPVGVGAFRADGTMIVSNPRLAQMFGVPRERLVGAHAIEVFADPDGRYRPLNWVVQHLRAGETEVSLRRADGTRFWALVSGDSTEIDGEPVHLCWIFNITRRKQAEDALKVAKEEAEQAAAVKSAFLATMSHEIRTPMNGVLGMLELLARSKLDLGQMDKVTTAREAATSLLRIIDDVLDFSKIEAGKLDLERMPVSLTAILEGVAETLAPAASRKGLDLMVFVDPDIPPMLLGDPVRLRQILFNLGGNAIKFTEAGKVVLRIDLDGLEPGRARCRISVVDTGIGIAPEALEELFQPFTQAENSTARRFGGTGLGLSICRRLAGLMGGEVGVGSEPGSGSTFWFRITLDVAPAAGPPGADSGLSGLSVIVAMPDAGENGFVCRYLAAAGARVSAVTGAATLREQTQAAARDGRPVDVAVVDGRLYQAAVTAVREALAPGGIGRTGIPMVLLAEPLADGRQARLRRSGLLVSVARPVRRGTLARAVAVAVGRAAPEADGADAAPSAPRAPGPSDGAVPTVVEALAKGRLILVAEDNATNRKVILMQLNMLGYAAEVVCDGHEALEALSTRHYAALVTDCHMPGMDGFELTRRIREAEEGTGRHLPIIAFTANAMLGEAEKCLAAGLDDFLSKPVEIGRLSRALCRWVPPAVAAVVPPPPPPPPPPPAAAVPDGTIDLRVLSTLCGEDQAMIGEMLGEFARVSRQVCGDLAQALAARAAADIRHAAHNLKGSSRTAGARELAETTRCLEAAVSADAIDWAEVEVLAGAVQGAMARVEAFAESHGGSAETGVLVPMPLPG